MRNDALFVDVMAALPRPAGEAAPDWSARRAPSIVPKLILAGVVLVGLSAVFSSKVDSYLEQRREAAQLEEQREKGRAELERRAAGVAMRLLGERQKAWEAVSSLGVKAPPEGLGLPLPVPLKLDEQIATDAEAYATREKAPAVDAAIKAYKADTQKVLDYVARVRAEQQREAAAQARQPARPAVVEQPTPVIEAPSTSVAQAAQVERPVQSAPPKFEVPTFPAAAPRIAPPAPAPRPEKRQVTDW